VRVWVWVLVLAAGDSLLIQERAIDLTQRIFAFYILFDLYKVRSVFGVYFFAQFSWNYPRTKRCRLIAAIMRECVSTCEQILVYPQSRTPSCLARLSFSLFLARACCLSLSHTQSLSPPHPPTPLPPSPLHPSLTFFPQSESPGTNPFLPIFLDQVKRELVPCERHFVSIIVR